MTAKPQNTVISVMVAVPDAAAAVAWYKEALGATELWNLGTVVGLEILGAPFFVVEPANNGWESPGAVGTTTTRVEVFCDDPDTFIAHALAGGASGTLDDLRNHQAPWGIHRQGHFFDPYAQRGLSPLRLCQAGWP